MAACYSKILNLQVRIERISSGTYLNAILSSDMRQKSVLFLRVGPRHAKVRRVKKTNWTESFLFWYL